MRDGVVMMMESLRAVAEREASRQGIVDDR